jgi:hypothetical protein
MLHCNVKARGLASKSVLLTLPLGYYLISTSLQSVVRYYYRPTDHHMLALTIEMLFVL